MKRFLWLGGTALLLLMGAGCGDVFRPIIIPNPPTFPNPKAAHSVVAVNNNGQISPGSALVVDVSGDSEVSIGNVGVAPVHAVQQSANVVLILNQATTTTSATSLSRLSIFATLLIAVPGSNSLPPNSAPNFVAVAPTDTIAYVTLPNLVPDTKFPNDNAVGAVNTNTETLVATIKVGNCPMAIAVTPDKSKVYVANNSSFCSPLTAGGSISAFNTLDQSPRAITGTLSSPPQWLISRSDSQRVYVLESSGTLAWLDTTTTPGPDTLTETTISVPGATTMVYDGLLNRLYIPGGSEVAVVDVSQPAPMALATVAIAPVSPSTRGDQDPCSPTAPATFNAVNAAALPDGSRAYIGAYYGDASGNICPQVTVINTSNNSVKAVIGIPGFPKYDTLCASTRFRFTMAAGGDSSRVYLASCDGGGVNDIDTSNDSFLVNLPAPFSARPPIPPSQLAPPQNPVFLIAGP